jgi:hypothetical protein
MKDSGGQSPNTFIERVMAFGQKPSISSKYHPAAFRGTEKTIK